MSERKAMDRRTFLTLAGGVVGGFGTADHSSGRGGHGTKELPIPTRRLGKTGAQVTIIGLPGWHVGRMREESVALKIIHRAFDRGINFYDSAWAYEMGRSEERLGKGLLGKRQKIFLMTKTIARDRKGAELQLEQSLRRLQTDYLDLWQFHSISSSTDMEKTWGPDGAMEAAVRSRKTSKFFCSSDSMAFATPVIQVFETILLMDPITSAPTMDCRSSSDAAP